MGTGPGWVLFAALAAGGCGDVVAAADAGGGDSDGGGGEADARPPGDVRVTLRGGIFGGQAEVVPDAEALFLGPDGTVLLETRTDERGEATASDVPSGSTVVVFPPVAVKGFEGAGVASVGISVHGVEPGDDIELGGESERPASLGVMTFTLPLVGGSGLSYEVSNGCFEARSSTNLITLDFYPPCVLDSGDPFTYLARVVNPAGEVIEFGHGQETFDSGGMINLPSWDLPRQVSVAFSELPSLVDHLGVSLQGVADRRGFFDRQNVFLTLDPSGRTVTEVPGPSGFGTDTIVEVAYASNQTGLGTQSAFHRGGPDVAALDLVVRDELLAWYGQPLFDPEARAVVLSRTGGGEVPDTQVISSIWRAADESFHYWLFVAPPEADTVAFPVLPETLAERLPDAPSMISFGTFGIESSTWEGYDDARQHGFAGLLDSAPLVLLDGPGRLRVSVSTGVN